MLRFALILFCAAFTGGIALADDSLADDANAPTHGEKLLGHDGNQWIMEGCAAYPVNAATKTRQDRARSARNNWTRPKRKLARNTQSASAKTATE